jgi:hypothetical protein
MKIKYYAFLLVALFMSNALNAQLINQFKKEVGVYNYLQFPTEDVKKSKLTMELIESNMLGTAAKKVIKNEKISGALTKDGGIFSDDKEVTILDLIPQVFVTDGDLYAEVKFSPEFMSKKTMNLPQETYNFIADGNPIQAIVSINVYSIPENELIYTLDKRWVKGMMAKPSSSSSTGITTTSGSAITNATKNMVRNWAKNKLDMLYGMGIRSKTLTSYMIKKLDKQDKAAAKETQEKLVSCINTMRQDRKGDAYVQKLDECIAHYNKILKMHKPGTKKQKESKVTDNNVWCLHYNLAVAYLLKEDQKNAKLNIDKASEYRVVKTKVFTNKKGEKVGEAKGMVPSGYAEIGALKSLIHSYFAGVEKMPKTFVTFLNDENKIRKANRIAREWAANSMLSTAMGLETPAVFKPESIAEGTKGFTGSVSEGDKTVDFVFKKAFLIDFFGYKLTATSADKNTIASVKYNRGSYRPSGTLYKNTYKLYIGDDKFVSLASGVFYKNGKHVSDKTKLNMGSSSAKGNKHPFSGSKFQYDYNGDIVITNVIHREKGLFYSYVLNNPNEYLGVTESKVRIKHTDYKTIESVTMETSRIEREREMKLGEALAQKKVAPEELIPTTEISNNNCNKTINIKNIKYSKDDKENCTKASIEKCEVNRTYIY